MTEVGETVTRVDTLIKEIKAFQKICNTDIERAEEVVSTGEFSFYTFRIYLFYYI